MLLGGRWWGSRVGRGGRMKGGRGEGWIGMDRDVDGDVICAMGEN